MSTNQLMSPEVNEIALALSKFQSGIHNVIKNKAGYEYKYAELSEYLNTIRGPLSENDLALVQLIANNPENPDQEFLVTMILHKSGQWIKSTFNLKSQNVVTKDGRNKINDMQSLGSGISYLRRYAIASICGLSQEDDDGASSNYKKNDERYAKKEDVNYGKKLVELCKHNDINPSDFAKFFNIKSSDMESVKNAVDNFIALKNDFFLSKESSDGDTLTEEETTKESSYE